MKSCGPTVGQCTALNHNNNENGSFWRRGIARPVIGAARYFGRRQALVDEREQFRVDDAYARERYRLMRVAIDIAEKLDELERRLDPDGPPPRHASMAYQRLRAMTQDDQR